ncbi:MAG: MoaD/ThiS family protein [Sulfolobaceae archaeon]
MKVKVKLIRERTEKVIELPDNSTVKDALRKLGYSTQSVVVVKDGSPIVEEEKLRDNDEIVVYLIASGG